MRKKTDKLLVHVPDVNIRDRSDVEAEDEAEESDEHETEENSHKASRKVRLCARFWMQKVKLDCSTYLIINRHRERPSI